MSKYFLKKIILSCLTSLVLLFSIAPYTRVGAQESTWYDQDYFSWHSKVYDKDNASEIFGERYTAAQVQWIIYSIISTIFSTNDTTEVITCLMKNSGEIENCEDAVSGALGSREANREGAGTSHIPTNQSILGAIFADRPLSGIGYVKDRINNFKLIPEVKAQTPGFGFSALSPIQDMWRGTRNVAFGLFVLASIIFAFMIMFRVKINPQTVVTVQSAIPKVITSLILVTFSYAIAGFMIDLMYVVIGILSVMLTSLSPLFNEGSGGLQTIGTFNFLVYGQPLGKVQFTALGFIMLITVPMMMGLTLLLVAGAFLAGVFTAGILGLIPLILLVIVYIMAIWNAIKIIWALFKAFANIILLTIFAPIQIVLGALISNFGFGQWVRSFASNLAVFVTTGVLGYLSVVFTWQGLLTWAEGDPSKSAIVRIIASPYGIGEVLQRLPIPDSPWPPLLGSGDGVFVGILFLGVAFVLFTMIPKATEVVQSFLAGKPFAYGSAIGEAVGVGKALGQFGLGYGFGKFEDARAAEASRSEAPYNPHPLTQGLRAVGILPKK